MRRHHQGVWVELTLTDFDVGDGLWVSAGSVAVEVGVEALAGEGVDEAGMALRDVAVAEVFTNDGAFIRLGQRTMVALARACLGLFFNEQRVQELGDPVIDVFRGVVVVEVV